MKTTKNNNGKKASKVNVLAIAAAALMLCLSTKAQKNPSSTQISVGADRYISGNLLGAVYSPYLNIGNGAVNVFGGPVFQNRTGKMGGARAGVNFNITGGTEGAVDCEGEDVDGLLSLKGFGYIQYTKDLSLSYRAQIEEERCSVIEDYDWSQYKVSALEFCGGVELNVRIGNRMNWKNYAGFTICNQKNHMQGMWNDKTGAGLLLGTGLTFRIK